MRLKQTVPHGNNNNEPAQSPQQNSSSTFDPAHFRLLLGQRLTEIHKERGGGAMPPFPFFNPTAAMVSPASLSNLPPLPPHHLLAAAMREQMQMSGLDLSMTSIKKEDSDSDSDSDDSNLSADFSQRLVPAPAPVKTASRRKPAAPQWVNPEWQEDKEKDDVKSPPAIINGVCVMQTDNFSSRNSEVDDETLHIEPTQPDKEKGEATKEVTPETTIELGVNATTEAESEVNSEEVDDWEDKITETTEDTDKPVKAGSEEWEF
jgi:homeobox protein cut-like